MKYLYLFIFVIATHNVFSQSGITWDAGINVATSANDHLHPRIVVDRSGDPIVLWGKLSSKSVMLARWDSAMAMFTSPVAINPMMQTAFVAGWAGPDIASYGDTIYVVYKVSPEDTGHMFVAASYDGGMSFDQPVQVDQFIDSISRFPTITTDKSGHPIIGFMKFDNSFMNAHYVVCRSNDYGFTYEPDVLASRYSGGDVCDCCPGSVVSSGDTVTMLYRDNLNNNRTIWTGISTDNGQSFPNGLQVDHTNWMINACPSTGPDAVVIGDTLYSVFMSGASANRCYLNKTYLPTQVSGSDQQLGATVSGLIQNYPRIAKSGNRVAIAFKQIIGSSRQLALFYSDDITTIPITNTYDTVTINDIENADVIMTDDHIYVVWQDNTSGTVRFKRGTLPANTTTIANDLIKSDVVIFPSPAKNYFGLHSQSHVESAKMFDMLGNEITLVPNNEFSLFQFETANGVYIVDIMLSDGSRFRKELLIRN